MGIGSLVDSAGRSSSKFLIKTERWATWRSVRGLVKLRPRHERAINSPMVMSMPSEEVRVIEPGVAEEEAISDAVGATSLA